MPLFSMVFLPERTESCSASFWGVSGIGPKGALGILSGLSADDLRFAVLADDAKTIAKAPGIGLKTAKKADSGASR